MTVESVSVVDPYSPGLSKSIAIVDRRRIPVTSLTWRLISSFANGKGTDAQAVQIEGDTIAIHRLVFFVIGLRIFLISVNASYQGCSIYRTKSCQLLKNQKVNQDILLWAEADSSDADRKHSSNRDVFEIVVFDDVESVDGPSVPSQAVVGHNAAVPAQDEQRNN